MPPPSRCSTAHGGAARRFVSGGTRRNLDWACPHLVTGTGITEDHLLLLADAQTSGGLLVAGEVPGYPIIGHLTAAEPSAPGSRQILTNPMIESSVIPAARRASSRRRCGSIV